MSGGHVHALTVHGHGPVHRLPAETKIAGLLVFVLAVVVTPPEQFWAFAIHALLLLAAVVTAELPIRFFASRLLIELPFVLFAVFLPFLGGGPRVDALGMSLSQDGLWAAWSVLAKGTLGVGASIVLVATTEIPDLLRGLERLRMPRVITSIAGFMVRYLEVVVSELGRVRTAIAARLGDLSRRREAATLAAVSGTMFIRAYERGERIHQAMLARGYQGVMPAAAAPELPVRWSGMVAWAASAWVVAAAAILTT